LTNSDSGAPPSNQKQMSNADITSLFSQPQPQSHFTPPPQNAFSALPPQQPLAAIQKVDPFASISSSHASRTASPFQFQQSTLPPPSILAAKSPQQPLQRPAEANPPAAQEDEWDFASALPSTASSTLTLTNSAINISWELSRSPEPGVIEIKSKISNNSPQTLTGLAFQIAVTKVNPHPSRQCCPPNTVLIKM
jgi:hypothetical protein